MLKLLLLNVHLHEYITLIDFLSSLINQKVYKEPKYCGWKALNKIQNFVIIFRHNAPTEEINITIAWVKSYIITLAKQN